MNWKNYYEYELDPSTWAVYNVGNGNYIVIKSLTTRPVKMGLVLIRIPVRHLTAVQEGINGSPKIHSIGSGHTSRILSRPV